MTAAGLALRLAVFAKAPLPGYAKTRLIPLLGAEGAARLAGTLIARTLALAEAVRPQALTLWCAPSAGHPYFRALAAGPSPPRFCTQTGADLGARMHAAFTDELARGPTLLIGTDCPALTAGHLHAAAEAIVLDANDIYRDAVEAAQSRKDALAQAGIASMAIVRLQVKGRISWVSPLGTPGVQLLDKEHTRKARREH